MLRRQLSVWTQRPHMFSEVFWFSLHSSVYRLLPLNRQSQNYVGIEHRSTPQADFARITHLSSVVYFVTLLFASLKPQPPYLDPVLAVVDQLTLSSSPEFTFVFFVPGLLLLPRLCVWWVSWCYFLSVLLCYMWKKLCYYYLDIISFRQKRNLLKPNVRKTLIIVRQWADFNFKQVLGRKYAMIKSWISSCVAQLHMLPCLSDLSDFLSGRSVYKSVNKMNPMNARTSARHN